MAAPWPGFISPEGSDTEALTGRLHRWARGQGFCLQKSLALYCLCNIEGQ